MDESVVIGSIRLRGTVWPSARQSSTAAAGVRFSAVVEGLFEAAIAGDGLTTEAGNSLTTEAGDVLDTET